MVSVCSRPAPRHKESRSLPRVAGAAAAPLPPMRECDFCGCYSPEHEKGWVAYPGEDDPAVVAPGVLIFCPPCAAAVFGYRRDAAVEHVCIWGPQPPARDDDS